jgi:hypothetical protein
VLRPQTRDLDDRRADVGVPRRLDLLDLTMWETAPRYAYQPHFRTVADGLAAAAATRLAISGGMVVKSVVAVA